MEEREVDVVVLGCGTGGSKAASVARAAGASVVAIEGGERLGGLCILRGCMPTKTLLETAHRVHEIKDAGRFGIEVGAPVVDFARQMERMRSLVERFRSAKERGVRGGGYELVWGSARFVERGVVEAGGVRYRGKAFVVATGSRVRGLGVEVAEGAPVVDSDAMFELEAAPKRAVVLGAGAVGLEFAQWMARMGSEVTLVNRSGLLSRSDPEVGAELAEALGEELRVWAPARLVRIEGGPGRAEVVVEVEGEERRVEAELVLNATGRVPRWDEAGLEVWGEEPVRVDGRMQGPWEGVFFAGDATGERLILHEANLEGAVAGRNAARAVGVLEGELEALDPRVPPVQVTFTDPVYASVGRTPAQLEAAGVSYRVAEKRFPEQGRGIVMGHRWGRLRLVAGEDGAVLGCQILNPRADDLIHVPATVMTLGGTVADFHRVPWYHPTLAEAFIEVTRALL